MSGQIGAVNVPKAALVALGWAAAATAISLYFQPDVSHWAKSSVIVVGFLLVALTAVKRFFSFVAATMYKPMLPNAPVTDAATGRITYTNWGLNHKFTPQEVIHPTSLQDLLKQVEVRAKKGRKIVPAGTLHSWSNCFASNDVSLQVMGMDKVLRVDEEKLQITVESGIRLYQLYDRMAKHRMAFPTLPNVDSITLGGAVANATHGTNFAYGTFASLVQEIQVVVFRGGKTAADGKAELLTLKRSDKDPQQSRWFDAVLVSFGCMGIVYSYTMQAVRPFRQFVHELSMKVDDVLPVMAQWVRDYKYIRFMMVPMQQVVLIRIQSPIPADAFRGDEADAAPDHYGADDLMYSKLMVWSTQTTAKNLLWLRTLTRNFLHLIATAPLLNTLSLMRRRLWMGSWKDAELESRLKVLNADSPWVNHEYAVPVDRAATALKNLCDITKRHGMTMPITMRPIGADDRGYLSPTKDRGTVYFDIPYERSKEAMAAEIEQALLACEGRCSWSRYFKAGHQQVLKQFPEFPKFKAAKEELDPFNVFSNVFSNPLFGYKSDDDDAKSS